MVVLVSETCENIPFVSFVTAEYGSTKLIGAIAAKLARAFSANCCETENQFLALFRIIS